MKPISIKEIANAVSGTIVWGDENIMIESVTTDSRRGGKNMLFIPLVGDTFDGHEFIRASFDMGSVAALTQKDTETICGHTLIRVEDTKQALAMLARFYIEKFDIPVVAVTGSVGKTTTKDMCAAALSEKYRVHKTQGNFNNDIGLPLTIFELEEEHDICVLEMGMNHFGEIHHLASIARPQKALITNIGMSHIENLGSQEGILSAKLEVTDFFGGENNLFINGDDELLCSARHTDSYKIISFGIKNKECNYVAENIIENGERVEFDIFYEQKKAHICVNLPGRHNVYNALAAFALAKSFDVSDEMITKGIAGFVPSKMRMDIKAFGELTLINDCYNASPASVEAALSVLCASKGNRRVAILGDILEMGDFAPAAHEQLGQRVAEMGIDMLLCVGEEAKNMRVGAIKAGMSATAALHFENNKQLIGTLVRLVSDGDAVLVKASRGMKFEQISAAIEELFGTQD